VSRHWSRREALQLAARLPLAAIALQPGRPSGPPRVVLVDGSSADAAFLRVEQEWTDDICRSRLRNAGRQAARVREVILSEFQHGLRQETRLYGEGFQMLSQTAGTLGAPADLGNYTDIKHYRLIEPDGSRAVYNALTLSPPSSNVHHLLAFTSTRRYVGKFRLQPSAIHIVIDIEGLEIAPGEAWPLEDVMWRSGPDRDALLAALAATLNGNHPRLHVAQPPSGWCSWYCFGPNVTADQVLANLDVIARDIPGLKYIQIDDGYQPAMGDWLETGAAFGGNVQSVLKQIRSKGFEPAIWVAPFIAEAGSRLFKEHPGWFVRDDNGEPLRADRVTFGGWRRGPWYALDGTHLEAQSHLTRVFRTMRQEWDCSYFKLDANFWGAIHGGRFHDPRATRVDAYRRGMQAVLKGAGDAFILGCNHPIWPSLGLIHGSRSSNDIRRTWDRIATTARQNLMRNWQNGTLWWNDPDAVVLTGDLPEEEFRFHATAIYAAGGMILSGDDLTTISPSRMAMLRKLQPPTAQAARFVDDTLQVGMMPMPNGVAVALLNWDDQARELSFTLRDPHVVHELWTEDRLGTRAGNVNVTVPQHGGRVMVCVAV
jgi:alpha-galactosidase